MGKHVECSGSLASLVFIFCPIIFQIAPTWIRIVALSDHLLRRQERERIRMSVSTLKA